MPFLPSPYARRLLVIRNVIIINRLSITDVHLAGSLVCKQRLTIYKDVPISTQAQLILPDIQLLYACRVFRTYVKSLGDRACYRVEEAVAPGAPFLDALQTIGYPINKIESLEQKVDNLSKLVVELLGSSKFGHNR